MKRQYIADIKPDDQVADVFRVVEARLAPYRDESKGQYMHLLLADRSGQVEGRLWEQAEEAAAWLNPGDVVRVRARAKLYQDRIRLRVDSLELAEESAPAAAELLPAPMVDVAEALAALNGAVTRIGQPALRELLESFLGDTDFVTALSMAPVERPGALLAATVQLLELASAVLRLAPKLDADLLLAAVLLHGAGHTAALSSRRGNKAVAWLGAAALSDQLVSERLSQQPDFPPDLAIDLRHAILASGDASAARSPEALALARLKELQAALPAP